MCEFSTKRINYDLWLCFVAMTSTMHLLPLYVCTKHRSIWSTSFLGTCGKGFIGQCSGYRVISTCTWTTVLFFFPPSFCTWSCRLIAWTMASMATGLDVLPTVESRPLYIMIRFQVRISLGSHDLVIRGWSWNVALCVLLDHGYLCLNLMLQQGLWDCIVSCSCNFPSKMLFV